MINASQLQALLEAAFKPTHIEVLDQSAGHAGHAGNTGGGYFKVTLVSDAFRNKTRVARHQMVYQALDGKIGHEIHALALTTWTAEERGVGC